MRSKDAINKMLSLTEKNSYRQDGWMVRLVNLYFHSQQ